MNKRWIYPTLSFTCVLMLWESLGRFFNVPIYILPLPSQIIRSLITERHVLLKHGIVTLEEALIGLILSACFAFIIGLLMDSFKGLRLTIFPHLIISQTIPVLVLGPIFSIWFGFNMTPKILIVILMCFFPIVVAFTDALLHVNHKKVDLLKTYGASTAQIYRLVKIPEALPAFFSGLKVSATYCVGGAIVGEWLSASAGLGYYMIRAKNGYLLDKVFATIVVIMMLSLCLNASINAIQHILIKKRMISNG
ncbi:MAG: ABC transporter permease [Vagococcus sp.]